MHTHLDLTECITEHTTQTEYAAEQSQTNMGLIKYTHTKKTHITSHPIIPVVTT